MNLTMLLAVYSNFCVVCILVCLSRSFCKDFVCRGMVFRLPLSAEVIEARLILHSDGCAYQT
jgi:hypothetical protein